MMNKADGNEDDRARRRDSDLSLRLLLSPTPSSTRNNRAAAPSSTPVIPSSVALQLLSPVLQQCPLTPLLCSSGDVVSSSSSRKERVAHVIEEVLSLLEDDDDENHPFTML
jgi:hypothetical protein